MLRSHPDLRLVVHQEQGDCSTLETDVYFIEAESCFNLGVGLRGLQLICCKHSHFKVPYFSHMAT